MAIPPDKCVIITGDPRSRTSLMMLMLQALGVPIAGDQFPATQNKNLTDEEKAARLARTKKLNPDGFFEVSGLVIKGIYTDAYRDIAAGKAVKVISAGAWPQGQFGTPASFVDRYILCLRNPQGVAASQANLSGDTVQVAGPAHDWTPHKHAPEPNQYLSGTGQFAMWLAAQPAELQARVLAVDYSDWSIDFTGTLNQVAAFMGVIPTADQLAAAAAIFDPTKTAVVNLAPWSNEQREAGLIAEQVYGALRTADWGTLNAIKPTLDDYIQTKALAFAPWVDVDPQTQEDAHRFFGTFSQTSSEHYNLLLADTGGCLTTSLKLLAARRAQKPSGVHVDCPHYKRSAVTADIRVPLTLTGFDLAADGKSRVVHVPQVDCSRDSVTRSQGECKECYHHGLTFGTTQFPPQRFRGGA